ncbi:ferritin-like domain-containing protein [uncultured Alistipes sp.]|uniref:ferritin-like domain-containing protein n=1 Tax=uncultured Alistipes sp. TaxID=538949 RepID=UPI0026268D2C|nr:ferritin-like domain-containing protein [uncultured Alistipes sp.]
MKQETAEVLNLDVQKLIEMLNGALCEEWLAYYQYWIGARVIEGPMRSEIEAELLEHADEELSHAVKLVTRIVQLGGTPVLSPDQWTRMARCRYEAPTDPYVETILEQNLRSERCAIERYREIADYTDGIDYTTAKMAVEILEDELDHEQDILSYQQDIATLKKTLDKMMR